MEAAIERTTTIPFQRPNKRPIPIDFDDYRAYLRTLVGYLKETPRGFSYRQFARQAGYASSSFLKHVIDGERNLSQASIGKVAKALGLDGRDRDDFELLVRLGQSHTDAERNPYYMQLQRRRRRQGWVPVRDFQYEIYSLWYAFPIREMLGLPDFKDDPAWIAERLHPPVRPADVDRAVGVLEQAGLLRRDENGKLAAARDTLETPANVPSLAVRNYHRQLLQNAVGGLDSIPVEKRNVTSLTVAMSTAKYEEVCKRIGQFQDELLEFIHDDPASKEQADVYQLGFTVIPVTRNGKP